jgi:putative ABC transport system substrate-binding protein
VAIDIARREFIVALSGATVAWPLAARAQQPTPPVIGFPGSASPETYSNFLAAFRQGLDDTGFVEPQNCRIEFRWARDQINALPALATELVNHKPAVIMTAGGLSPDPRRFRRSQRSSWSGLGRELESARRQYNWRRCAPR